MGGGGFCFVLFLTGGPFSWKLEAFNFGNNVLNGYIVLIYI